MPGSLWPQPTNGLVRPLQVGTGSSTNTVHHHHPQPDISPSSSEHASLLPLLLLSHADIPQGQMYNGSCRSSAFEKCLLCMSSLMNFLCSVALQLHAGGSIKKAKQTQRQNMVTHTVENIQTCKIQLKIYMTSQCLTFYPQAVVVVLDLFYPFKPDEGHRNVTDADCEPEGSWMLGRFTHPLQSLGSKAACFFTRNRRLRPVAACQCTRTSVLAALLCRRVRSANSPPASQRRYGEPVVFPGLHVMEITLLHIGGGGCG